MRHSTRTLLTGVTGTVLLSTVLAGCGDLPFRQAGGSASSQPSAAGEAAAPAGAKESPATPTVKLEANVADGATKVKVSTRVKVRASEGTLSKVKLTYTGVDGKGQRVQGRVKGTRAADGTSWKAADRLEPSATYTLAVTGKSAADETTTTTTRFKTQRLALSQQTFPTLYPQKGARVGVGMPVVVRFDVPVRNRAAVERNLKVTSSPAQAGSWHWFSGSEVRYRPKHFWKPGTKVSVAADVNGVAAGGGIYGQSSARTSFTVGRSLVTKVNLATDVATVYRNGRKVKTIYVSAGKSGWETRSGTKLIMAKEFNKKMTNEMIGAEEDYTLVARYALRITNSGEFLHSAPWNAGNFGRRNASHGCVGMSISDSQWLYENTLIGDPVITTGSNRGVEPGNGYSDWNESFAQYRKGSAL
jgi:lipoprotein-anchoring transpeptidase ErfK/SrfK